MPAVRQLLAPAKGLVRDGLDLTLNRLGLGQAERRLSRDAQAYWSASEAERWGDNTHVRGGGEFADDARWQAVGREHLALYDRLARAVRPDAAPGGSLGRVVEWGCGGGANAVHFAPRATEFVGVDVSRPTLDECARQVKETCDTPFVPVLAEVGDPEAAAARVGPCDLFLCCYVLELVPSPAYGLRLMRLAAGMLADDGLALVQIKYRTASWRTGSRGRRYTASALASMTSYRIEEFWTAVTACGLRPQLVSLVPENDLDERYAYFLLDKA